MTAPVTVKHKPIGDGTVVEKTMCFYLNSEFQDSPPAPTDKSVWVETRPQLNVLTR